MLSLLPAIPAPAPVIATIKPSLICELFPFLPKCDKDDKEDDDDDDDDDDEPPAVEVPGPLPVIGAGTAFLWSRRLRQRIRETGK